MEKGGGDRKKQERERETEKERERERERRIVALRRHFESIATTCLEEEKRRRGDERTRGRGSNTSALQWNCGERTERTDRAQPFRRKPSALEPQEERERERRKKKERERRWMRERYRMNTKRKG